MASSIGSSSPNETSSSNFARLMEAKVVVIGGREGSTIMASGMAVALGTATTGGRAVSSIMASGMIVALGTATTGTAGVKDGLTSTVIVSRVVVAPEAAVKNIEGEGMGSRLVSTVVTSRFIVAPEAAGVVSGSEAAGMIVALSAHSFCFSLEASVGWLW